MSPWYKKICHTFTDEVATVIHQSYFFANFAVNRIVFRKVIETQVRCQLGQVFFAQLLAEELGYFFDFSSQILSVEIQIIYYSYRLFV